MSQDSIALALGITTPTLCKHFMAELTAGAAAKQLEAMDALFSQVRKGNVAAIKAALLLGAAVSPPPKPGDQDAPAAPAAKLGKKEAAQVAAVSAADNTDWAGILPSNGSVQ